MKFRSIYFAILFSALFFSCNQEKDNYYIPQSEDSFEYKVDQFADLAILRYQIPGWDELTLKEKELVNFVL